MTSSEVTEPATRSSSASEYVSVSGLVWGVHPGFVRYVERMRGRIEGRGSAGRVGDDQFFFGLEKVTDFDLDSVTGTLNCEGSVRFRAHADMLNVTIQDLELVTTDRWTELRSGEPGKRISIATMGRPGVYAPGQFLALRWDDVRLTAAGAEFLGGVYETGEPASPLFVRLALDDQDAENAGDVNISLEGMTE